MIKAIIFDLNGVFIRSPYLSDRVKDKFGVLTEEFLPVLKEIMDKVRKPDAGDALSYWEPYLEKWGIKSNKEKFLNFWFSGEKELVEMIRLARELKDKGVKLFILSNNFKERSEYYKKHFPFLDELFIKVYYSWQTGFIKPDPMAYKNLLEENKLKPEECIYFDDSEKNVEVASSLGVKAFLFKNAQATKETIK